MVVDVTYIRTILKLNGLDTSDYTDEELIILYKHKESEIESYISWNISPTTYKEIIPDVLNDFIILHHYPIMQINYVIDEDNEDISSDIKLVNENNGIIYFKEYFYSEFVKVEYVSGLTESEKDKLIKPLILDMIAYSIKYGYNTGVSSAKEGDVSVNYDTTSNLGATINNRIEKLNNRFSAKTHLL